MERRTFESPMDWEYQNSGPLDPTSPFVQTAQRAQNNNAFGLPKSGSFGPQSAFSRTQSSPHKLPPPSPGQKSIFATSNAVLQRTNTAPAFRNPAFTTPRKPFDMDALSEASPAEDSPAQTDISENYPDTPETDNMRNLNKMALTPARSKALSVALNKRSPGKGDILRPVTAFGGREKVRKRKRRHDDKDISGFRLPYKYQEEWDESEGNDTDDSVYEPNKYHGPNTQPGRKQKGWFSGFLSVIQKHPDAPIVLGSWVTLMFNLAVVGLAMWLLWVVVASFRDDFWAAKQELRAVVVEEMAKCARDYADNRCSPREQRLPAMNAMCDEWETCMNQNPDNLGRVRLGARNIVEILNEIIETMHWKTLAAFIALFAIFCFSGISLVKSSQSPSSFAFVPHPPQASQPVYHNPQLMYGHIPQTPRTRFLGHYQNDETPDTDASPDQKALPPPIYYQTPSRRSPSKGDRGRSPTKSRSPTKKY
ncbi:hypothetical protein PFICI_13324 [Pestalotiopsis fici W106-1]|uniref:Brl1/Brr6 domain-containing protein n=1 Tax=Pestalotiopsis fici (strain W106-1 / CGMCC3.15140) TaxID=1229662 RepID=W3WLQ0_PESFW|nr:uncharacterized protein PFICI_13324 [Pestalotiopsis fici W106-1]ETS74840.1 hypothetical protein PFICI_13324 [Pestalotiopsis fici W106-1]